MVEFNRAAERTFGHARADVLGQEMCELIIPPELRDAHRRGLAHAVGTGENRLFGQRLELTGIRADGSRFPLELTITPMNNAGAPLFTGWLRDISERKRSDEERERLLRSALLTDASELLGASLDYEHTLVAIARAVVPRFADWCAVDILADDGSIKHAAVAHADPAREKCASELRSRYPTRPDAPAGSAKVIRSGSSELVRDITDSALEGAAQDDEHFELLREAGLRSAIVVPMRAHGQTLGALSLLSADSGRRYDADDLALAEELANRCALAIDNARLYAAARESEERFRQLVEGTRDYAILMLDPDGHVLSWNAGAERINGYSAEEIIGEHFSRFYPPEDLERDKPASELRRAKEKGRYEWEGWRLRKDGSCLWSHVIITALHADDGRLRGFSKVTQDVTARKQLEDQLTHQALHDALTGLPNRKLFLDQVGMALRRAKRSGSCTAVLFVDLDRFKLVNDSLGHAAGDELLRAVAGRLIDAVREIDTVARLAGDEFNVLCEEIDVFGAVTVAERISAGLAEPFEIAGEEVFAGASIGIALGGGEEKDAHAMLHEADAAMYEAKKGGRAGYALFDERLRSRAAERLRAEATLRRAIERDELRVVYQPLLNVASGEVVGAEALVRWDQSEGPLVSPAAFIPLAEETGLIVPLGAFVLEKACRQAVRWNCAGQREAKLAVAVNVSARQLKNGFPEEMRAALATSGADPTTICLEVTESTLMRDTEAMSAQLATLSELGVELAIDDFGTGYSSLSYLRHFPIDTLKVDRSFVEGLGERADDRALVTAITSMAHALDLTVVAEGVETPAQLSALRELDCDLAQGYYFARPGPVEAIDDLLRASRTGASLQ